MGFKAMELYKKSAQRGDIITAPGMVAVGKMYVNGHGVARDLEEAKVWFQRAVDAGDKKAADEIKKI